MRSDFACADLFAPDDKAAAVRQEIPEAIKARARSPPRGSWSLLKSTVMSGERREVGGGVAAAGAIGKRGRRGRHLESRPAADANGTETGFPEFSRI